MKTEDSAQSIHAAIETVAQDFPYWLGDDKKVHDEFLSLRDSASVLAREERQIAARQKKSGGPRGPKDIAARQDLARTYHAMARSLSHMQSALNRLSDRIAPAVLRDHLEALGIPPSPSNDAITQEILGRAAEGGYDNLLVFLDRNLPAKLLELFDGRLPAETQQGYTQDMEQCARRKELPLPSLLNQDTAVALGMELNCVRLGRTHCLHQGLLRLGDALSELAETYRRKSQSLSGGVDR